MKALVYLLFGIIFSIILIKVEAISWFRIQEMFRFQSFHMFGVLFSGILVAIVGVQIIKKKSKIQVKPKELKLTSNIVGGLLFGLGWGITGACTGPIYSLIGVGYAPVFMVLVGGIAGTFIYAITKSKLPH